MATRPPSTVQLSAFQRLLRELRTEAGGRGEQALAVGVGVFIGCLPLWGLHLAICIALGKLLRLNRVKMYAAANISNPFFAPLLVIAAVQVGSLVRRRDLYGFTWSEWRHVDPWSFGLDYLVGSLVVGGVLGVAAAGLTWVLTRPTTHVHELLAHAADRYLPASITAWEFARNKLRADPLYASVVLGGRLPQRGRLLDIGCGQGLLLAALATARHWHEQGHWPPHWPAPPYLELEGFDLRQRPVSVAQTALGEDATVTCADARTAIAGPWEAIAICDVLHLLSRAEQDALLSAVAAALAPGGVLLVREADAAGGWRFGLVRLVNFANGLVRGRWPRFAFRTGREWATTLRALHLEVELQPTGRGFANVLLVGQKPVRR